MEGKALSSSSSERQALRRLAGTDTQWANLGLYSLQQCCVLFPCRYRINQNRESIGKLDNVNVVVD